MATPPPFDPHAFAQWLVEGLKETVRYRLRQTFRRDKMVEYLRDQIPSRNQALHALLRKTFEKSGFHFEKIQQGDAVFHLIRKRFRESPSMRRLVLIPGFGDTPASWIPAFGFSAFEWYRTFDEIIILDFPGYLGFLSESEMIPSMAVLLGVVKTVCEVNPPTVLMGHSLGGWLAGRVAQQLSRPVEHLILVSPSGLTPESERKAFGDQIINSQNLTIDELLDQVIHSPKKIHQLLRDDLRDFYSKPQIKEFIESVKHENFIDDRLPFSAKKLTVIWGENDRFVPVHWLRYWVESYGEYLDAYLMKKTGHLPQIERPQVFAEVIMHALLGKVYSGKDSQWIKVHHRKKEFQQAASLPAGSEIKRISELK